MTFSNFRPKERGKVKNNSGGDICDVTKNDLISNVLLIPMYSGTGELKTTNWYFDPTKEQCTAFLYLGSQGNANRFETLEQCERQCGTFKNQVCLFVCLFVCLSVLLP